MRLVEKSQIDRPPSAVWPFVIRPEFFRKWNKKVISMEARDIFILGQPFITHYKMSGKEIQCTSMATEIEEGRLLVLRHTNCIGDGVRSDLEVTERVTLRPSGPRTVVNKEVVIKNHGAPWILIPLIWFINRFGKPAERDELKFLCETDPA